MRYAYGALVLTSLIWPKDPSGDLGRQTPREGSLRPCRGESKWTQFHNTFGLYPGLCWVCENPWGVHLAGTLVLLFWLLVETWASSCLASLRAKPRETAASLPDPQSEMQRDVDFQIPQPRGSLCICGRRLSSDLESYQPPCERQQGPSSVIYHITGARPQNEVRPDYERSRSPSLSRGALRTLSPSPSPSSSSSSSSSSSCCLTRLKHLDFPSSSGKFPTTMEDSSSMAYDSSEESESKVSDLCSEAADPKVLEIKHKFSYISLQPERLPRMREMPECSPEEEKSQPVPSFAQINYTQSSAYEKEGGIVLVERSFEIHMGEMPPDVGRPDPLTSMFAGQEESQEKPKALALLDHMAHPHVGGTLKLHSFPIISKTPPQTGHLGPDMSIRPTSALGDFDPDAFVLDKMDEEILNFLEFHVKKKMVQRQCGVPTVVVRSVQRFQSLEDLRHVEFEREHVRPVKRLMRMPLRAKSPAGLDFQARNAMAIGAKPWQKCPGAKEYYILHPVTPEEMKSLVSGPAMKKPSVKMALFQGMREKYVLLSMEPDELRRIVFHITVKMLEIKRGTFPEVVERSFRIFSSLSARPLPKTIRWGNKVTRPKHVLLPFVPGEALCLIDLNIQHKYLVHVWRLPTPYSKSEEEMTTAASQPSGPEGHVFKGHKPRDPGMPIFILKIPKGKAGPQAPESQKLPAFPSPQLAIAGKPPEGRPEKSPEEHTQKLVHFVDIFSAQMLAHEVPPESTIMPREAAAVGTQESIEPGEPGVKRAASSKALPLALSKEGGTTSGEGMEAQKGEDVDGTEEGGKKPKEVPEPSSEGGPEPCGEGASSEAGLPPPSGKEAEEAERRDGPAAAKEVLLPPSVDATGKDHGERTGAGEAQQPPKETERRSSLPSSKEKGLEGDGPRIHGARAPPKPPQRPASCKAALSLDKRGGTEAQKEAEADGMRPRTKEASKRPKEASIVGKASISLKLDVAKEKVNLHLQKKLDAKLRPKQAAHLNLDVEVDKAAGGSRRAKKTPHRSHHHRHHHHHDPPPAAQAQAQAKPSRPFCYVCMPLDETGSAVKTVCWALPKRILEMNGNRVPRVARFESKPTGCK